MFITHHGFFKALKVLKETSFVAKKRRITRKIHIHKNVLFWCNVKIILGGHLASKL